MKKKKTRKKGFCHQILRCWQLYVLLLPTIIYFLIFNYAPMVGIQIAFRDYKVSKGFWESAWVGLKHFKTFLEAYQLPTLIENTVKISVYSLIWGFPIPIILALLLNESKSQKLKKVVQTLTYAPYFISTVVLVAMLSMFLSPSTGVINKMIEFLGGTAYDFMGSASAFRPVYIISGIWQGAGWSSIIYVAGLAGIDPQLLEAAEIDGANRFQKIWHVNLPGIMPIVVIQLIMSCGGILGVGYEKVYLMQNTLNQSVSEVISTYVYKMGLLNAQYSYTTAIGLFNTVINLAILLIVNQICKKVSEVSLF
ncbi:MAG: sugar ABC transporter permease [Roseburia sp.]|nr:sugar ABC transporter permease [Roseburia sp.]